ncbi:MAG: hypothetical protein NT000_00330 [Proteobacteria bacterium]|nr:hypothetical protein [Pseudomonadota bacterium]
MKQNRKNLLGQFLFLATLGFSQSVIAGPDGKPVLRKVQPDVEGFETLLPAPVLAPLTVDSPMEVVSKSKGMGVSRRLASGNNIEDLDHYTKLERRFGIDVGVMSPFGDFQKDFASAAMVGLHFTWEAIPPFALRVSTNRASSYHKLGAALGKLTVSQINIGTQASFPMNRFIPFLKFEGSFNFNDVSFGSTKYVTAGSDTFVSTVGLNIGMGIDFIVGREMSFGFEGTYHYQVPKKINLSDSTMFDLGSSYSTLGFRVNF